VLTNLDSALAGDDLLIVMPRADGSLKDALYRDFLTEDEKFEAFRQVANGLAELAAASVIHRDLKPANVLRFGPKWMLADFGIARNLEESTGTFTFMGAGTLPYMAPELWEGKPASVKTDLYALGVLAYEIYEGHRPFESNDEQQLGNLHRYAVPDPPANASAGVARLIVRLLAKNPTERPHDARAVVETLRQCRGKLSTQQEALRAAVMMRDQRAAVAAAARARKEADDLQFSQRRAQALAELNFVLGRAEDLIKDALPDATAGISGPRWYVKWESKQLAALIWPASPNASPGDPLVAALQFSNATRDAPLANAVCKLNGDKLEWSILRFRDEYRISGRSGQSKDFLFGLPEGEFLRLWRESADILEADVREVLTPQAVVDLFLTALELS
jgi:hypothetical protein